MTLTGHLLYALAWLSFGLLHSLLARGSAKRSLATAVPPERVPDLGLGTDADIHYSKATFLLGFVFGAERVNR